MDTPMPFYRVLAPASSATLISTSDADSYTDIVVANDDRPTMGSLKVRLKAKPFSGERPIEVEVTPGGFEPDGDETITDSFAL
ncbi:hypothetical protein D3C86_2048140 [compost metagenome]